MSAIARMRAHLSDATLIGIVAVISLAMIAANALPPRDPASGVGIVFAPWTSGDTAFLRAVGAGARFVRYGMFPFIVVVVPDAPGYAQRIEHDGAWMIVDPRSILACAQGSAR
jgi:hypothetical protein